MKKCSFRRCSLTSFTIQVQEAKEGLRDLNKQSFEIKTRRDSLDYIESAFNEKTT